MGLKGCGPKSPPSPPPCKQLQLAKSPLTTGLILKERLNLCYYFRWIMEQSLDTLLKALIWLHKNSLQKSGFSVQMSSGQSLAKTAQKHDFEKWKDREVFWHCTTLLPLTNCFTLMFLPCYGIFREWHIWIEKNLSFFMKWRGKHTARARRNDLSCRFFSLSLDHCVKDLGTLRVLNHYLSWLFLTIWMETLYNSSSNKLPSYDQRLISTAALTMY